MLTLLGVGSSNGIRNVLRQAIQAFLNTNAYSSSTLQNYPILTPEEPGTVAVPRGQRCARFDGVNDYATLGAKLTGAEAALTVSAWIKSASGAVACQFISGGQRSWAMSVTSALQVRVSADGGNTNFKNYSGGSGLNDGAWHQVAFVFSANALTLFVDGSAVTPTKTTDGTVNALFNGPANLILGSEDGAGAFLTGYVRDVRVYNVAKTAGEIAAIYNQASTPTTIDTTGLLGMWPLQEESGTTAYDISGNGKHLTLTNITQATFHATDSGVTYNYNNAKGHSKALQFGGVNNYATLGANLPVTGELAIACWFRPESLSTQQTLISNCGPTGNNISFHLEFNRTAGKMGFLRNGGTVAVVGATSLSVGTWYHVAVTVSGTVGNWTCKLYLNGVEDASATTTANEDTNSTSIFSIGRTGAFNGSYLSGVVRNVRIYNTPKSAGEVAAIYSGTNDTTGLLAHYNDQYDESGNGRNLTLVNGASVLVIPALLTTPSQDAAANALGVAGPVAHPVTVEVPCVTGDGSAARVDLGAALLPPSAGFDLSFWARIRSVTGVQFFVDQRPVSGAAGVTAIITSGASIYLYLDNVVAISSAIANNTDYLVRVTRIGNLFTLYLNGASVGTATVATTIGDQNTCLLALTGGGSSFASHSIAGLSITTGGVTKYPLFDQCGPGSSNTNRDFYIVGSDGSATLVSGGIVNGTIANIFANRCPYVKDWAIQYGGGIAANGSFVPGRINSNLDAAGNTKTLSAGKHGNPYSRIVPNTWNAPELVNIGLTSSNKMSPTDNYIDLAPIDTKFRRYMTNGSDRYFATLASLSGNSLTKAEAYTATPSVGEVFARVGTSTSPTSTGLKAVTGVGFTPKVVLPFGSLCQTDGTQQGANCSFGATTAASQAALSVQSQWAVTTSATHRRHNAAAAYDSIISPSGAVYQSAAYSAFGSDGFTLNWGSTVDARILNHICLGGADLEVSLTQQQMNGTNAAQSFAHGLSGAPTGVLFFGGELDSVPQSKGILYLSLGAWAGSNQFAASLFSNNGQTTTQTSRLLSTSSSQIYHQLGAAIRATSVSSVDATNVNITYPVTVASRQWPFHMLAIRGAKCQVGTFNTAGSTSPLPITTTGITPKLFLPIILTGGVQNAGTVLQSLLFAIGASDGTNNVSCGISDTNGNTTTEARRYQSSTTIAEYATDGTKKFEGTAAFSGESVIFTPTTAVNGYGQGGYLVIGS